MNEIAELIRKIVGDVESTKLQIATVISVDKNKNTAQCKFFNGLKITAELQSKPGISKGFHIYPAKDSSVMVLSNVFIKRYYIMQMEEIESVVLTTADKPSIEVIQNGDININGNITFNGGNNDGMVLINKLIERLNKIENEYNLFIKEYNLHTHMVAAVPATATIPTVVPTIPTKSTMLLRARKHIENTKITQ